MGTVSALFDNADDFADERDLRVASINVERTKDDRRYTSGLWNVDESAKPFRPGEFIVVGAREGQGKTSLIEGIALANSENHRVLITSLDMPATFVRDRLFSKVLCVGVDDVSEMESQNDERFQRAQNRLASHDLLVWEPESARESSVRAITKRAEDVTAAILIIDYCRLIRGWEPGSKAGAIVNDLCKWAHDSMITTILLTQLRDEAVNRRPNNGHIQDTTFLSQRADRIMLLYRPYIGRPKKDDLAELSTTKNRFGPVVMNHIGWIGDTMTYFPLSGEAEYNARCCPPSRK